MDKETPGRKAMKFFFEIRSNRKFSGKKRAIIHSTINRDITETKVRDETFKIKVLKSEIYLHNIGAKARNRKQWVKIVKQVATSAYFNTSK